MLHDDVKRPVRELAHEKHVHHVWMGDARDDLRLAVKAGHERLVRREIAMQDLHGNVAVDPSLKSSVDAAHRPDAHELEDLDVAENLAPEIRVDGRDVPSSR